MRTFYATATLLNICMRVIDVADGGCGGGLDVAPMASELKNVGCVTASQARHKSSNVGVSLRAK